VDPHKIEFNIMSAFFSNILSSFSPLRRNRRESISTSGDEDVSGENVVAAAAAAATNDDLISYFNAHLVGTEMAMECANEACDCLSILDDKNVKQAVATYLVWFE
jgi:hypothetical protein